MRATTLYVLLALSLCGMILLSGCRTRPPEQERLLAEKAFKDAALGKDCDRENYIAVEELLRKAREEVNAKNYENAKKLFAAVKEKSDAVVEYVRSHPDECSPSDKKKDSPSGTGRAEGETEEVSVPTKDPHMVLPIIHFDFNEYSIRAGGARTRRGGVGAESACRIRQNQLTVRLRKELQLSSAKNLGEK